MAPVPLVTIINANGRLGRVATTYPPYVQGLLREAPADVVAGAIETGDRDVSDTVEPELLMPARNASTETWRAYALSRPDSGLSSDEVEAMNRDALVAHFHKEN